MKLIKKTVINNKNLLGWLMMLGEKVEVTSPKDINKELIIKLIKLSK